ncbi:MAG: diacylglycerol/lipid kinase family protein [Armatimonadota bacterium]
MNELLIFANRHAGALSRLGGPAPFERYARAAGFEPRIVYTRNSAHLRRLLREEVIGKHSRVAVAGGDGTMHSVAQALAGTETALGVLPQGTANNFATALRLPMDLPSAFRVIAENQVQPVDLGQIGDEYFIEAAGVGIFADMLAITGASHRLRNIVRASWAFLKMMLTRHSRRVHLLIDGEPFVEEALSVTVANSFCVGYNLPIAPHARLTDGKLDLVVIEALDRHEWLPYYRAIRAQVHPELPKIHYTRAREVRINARRPVLVHVDDRAWRRTPVTIRVVPKALNVLVDRL